MDGERAFDYSASLDRSVWSDCEWTTLEEVIVGDATGAHFPPFDAAVEASAPVAWHDVLRRKGGQMFPEEIVREARSELDGLARRLEKEGVVVRRPDSHPHNAPFSTPEWKSESGLYAAMPRDIALVVGNTIIEAPMAWRSRHFEINAYRTLFHSYFRSGCRWIAAPRPVLSDSLYATDVPCGRVTEAEPVFDAADFIRCGRLIVGQLSNVTNQFGVAWLRRHLPEGFEVVLIDSNDDRPMHIDATLLPLAYGKLLINPDRLPSVPDIFKDWDVRNAPIPSTVSGPPRYLSSAWISMNILSLDERRVLVERQETDLIDLLRTWGIEPIPLAFRHFLSLGGSFHCATLDVRRAKSITGVCEV